MYIKQMQWKINAPFVGSNNCAKKYWNRTTTVKIIVEGWVVFGWVVYFFATQCINARIIIIICVCLYSCVCVFL